MTYQAWHNFELGKKVPTIFFQLNARVQYPMQRKLKVNFSRLKKVKNDLLRNIQPDMKGSKGCVLMMLSNLAFPQWATVNCSEKRLIDVVCLLEKPNEQYSSPNSNLSCDHSNILHQHFCFAFHFYDGNKNTKIQRTQAFLKSLTDLQNNLKFLFLAIHATFPPILVWTKHDNSSVQLLSCHKIHEILKYKVVHRSMKSAKGFFVRQTHAFFWNQTEAFSHIFHCQKGNVISSLFVCDGIAHCGVSDLSDENYCTCSLSNMSSQCKFLSPDGQKRTCSPLYFLGRDNKCHTFAMQIYFGVPEMSAQKEDKCSNLHNSLENDLVVDCDELVDEQHLTHFLIHGKTFSCSHPAEIPCRMGHSKCFNTTDICVYRLNVFKNLIPCRTGEHVEACENFDCNNKFKCPHYYCLPWSYICDGKWDCPFGQDELIADRCGPTRHCQGMFKCVSSQLCIHIEDICDLYYDCPLNEDEQMCDLMHLCPVNCFCQKYAIFCFNSSSSTLVWNWLPPILSLHCDSMKLMSLNFVRHFKKLSFLKLPRNQIDVICGEFVQNTQLLQIVLSFNLVVSLDDFCFYHTKSLQILKLDHNKIVKIHWRAFSQLLHLKLLCLSHNQIQTMPQIVFESKLLYGLSLESNPLNFFESVPFSGSNIFLLVSDHNRICCVADKMIACFAVKSWHQSCLDLLPQHSLKLAMGTLACLTLLLNVLSIGLHQNVRMWARNPQSLKKESGSAFRIIVLSVNLSDLLCSLHLWILFAADQIFKREFVAQTLVWQGSTICFIIFSMSLNFSLISPCILAFMAFARLMVVLHPIETKFKRKGFILRAVASFTLVIFVITCSLMVYLKISFSKLPSDLCQPFIDPTHSVWMLKMCTVIICFVQTTSITSIIFMCIKLVLYLHSVRKHMKPIVSKSHSHINMYTQLVIIVLSYLHSWVPAIILHASSLFAVEYSVDLTIWIAIIVTSLNSVTNPVLFVTAALKT